MTKRRMVMIVSVLVPVIVAFGCDDSDHHPAPSATASFAPTQTATSTLPLPTATRTASPAPTHSPTAVATATGTASPTRSEAPTITATATATALATDTSSPTATATTQVLALYQAPAGTEPSGPRADGKSGVLPNGRIVAPIGRHAEVATLPTNLRIGPDGHVFVTNDGNGNADDSTSYAPSNRYLQVVDPQTLAVGRTISQHIHGLAVSPDGHSVYVANGPADRIDVYGFDGTTLSADPIKTIALPAKTFPRGIDLSPDGATLYAAGFLSNQFFSIDVASGTVHAAETPVGNLPYGVLAARDGTHVYVSSWGINNSNPSSIVPVPLPPTNPNSNTRSSVAVVDVADATPTLVTYVSIARSQQVDPKIGIYGGSHPSAMALSPDGTLLYVTATNVDLIDVIDTATNTIVSEINLNVFGDGLQGLYPDAVALNADGTRLYVADAGINAVQVIDVDATQRTFTSRGFIPTGWYPSALALSADGGTLFVASAKGLSVGGNGGALIDIATVSLSDTPYYIGHIIKGMVSAIDVAGIDLEQGTATVRANNGFNPISLEAIDLPDTPLPVDFGAGPSAQIKYVVYILKENRTYDQVLGDLTDDAGHPKGNGESRLTLFGEDVTPNTHAIARQFAIGDNFFDDAEVSYPGHEWITQGNNNDWVEKVWPIEYNGLLQTPFNIESGQEGFCKNGYIFEALERQHVPYRVYGEPLAFNSRFAEGINGGGVISILGTLTVAFGGIDKLVAHIGDLLAGDLPALRNAGVDVNTLTDRVWPNLKLDYPSNIIASKTDVFRAGLFKGELDQFAANNNLPNFLFIWLPNDHTFGAAPSMPTPRTAVADNDRGLGLVIDALSHSPFWSQMAIFVSEDDAQDAQDHVSAHRTLSLVVSPYVKRGYVSSVHSSNVGMLKTMELLLGVQPMSQYDRYATDMRDYFTSTPDLTPFAAVAARVRPETNPTIDAAPNPILREAAAVSSTLDFDEYDSAGAELSRVLWLVHVGEHVEQQRRIATIAAATMTAFLVGAGWVMQRRRRATRA